MGAEVLSQAEVENLLNAMQSSGEAASRSGPPADDRRGRRAAETPRKKSPPTTSSARSGWARSRCGPCRRCTRVSAATSGRPCRPCLRSIVEVKLTSVDQLTYSEFVFSLENPTCFNLLKAEPLEGNLILDINPSILYPIIDRLLGGAARAARWHAGH